MRSAITLGLGILIAAATPGLRAQVSPSTPNSVKSALGGAGKPAAPAATKPAPQAAKPAAKAPAKAAVKAVEKPATPGTAPAAAESEVKQARRDPFESLLGRQLNKTQANLPPGKLGLQVSTLRLDGIVRAPNGMIAVVSNPQARTYFLREGDRLYDGSVEKISMDGVSFHEEGKDAFGKPVERQVNKRIYSSPGEQQ
jgi:Tfp pilus assembly protein PilP